jgi:hypothetical protein
MRPRSQPGSVDADHAASVGRDYAVRFEAGDPPRERRRLRDALQRDRDVARGLDDLAADAYRANGDQ